MSSRKYLVSPVILSAMLARFLPKIFIRTHPSTHIVKTPSNCSQLSLFSPQSAPPEAHWVNRWGDPNRATSEKPTKEIMTPLRFDGRVAIVTGAGGGDDCFVIYQIEVNLSRTGACLCSTSGQPRSQGGGERPRRQHCW